MIMTEEIMLRGFLFRMHLKINTETHAGNGAGTGYSLLTNSLLIRGTR